MEELVDLGLVRHIGTSNMTIPKLKLLLRDARIKPAVNEMELHPHFQQPELFKFVVENGIEAVGYCPIGSPGRPDRDRTPEDTAPTEDRVIMEIARRHGTHPAAVCIKWAVQRGQTPIPFSVHHYRENLAAAAIGDPLTSEEMRAIATIDRKCRLIKGQVFLWKDGQTWQDLWDASGEITGVKQTTMTAAFLPWQFHRRDAHSAGAPAGSWGSSFARESLDHLRVRHSLHLSRTSWQRPRGLPGRDRRARALRPNCNRGRGLPPLQRGRSRDRLSHLRLRRVQRLPPRLHDQLHQRKISPRLRLATRRRHGRVT